MFFNKRVRLESREEVLVEDLLSRMSHLVVLKLHTVCTDQMLKIVGQVCLCLSVLDLSFAVNVTDTGVDTLCRFDIFCKLSRDMSCVVAKSQDSGTRVER